MAIRPAFGKTYKELTKEWDDIAFVRLNQIEGGQDISFKYILAPCILDLLVGCDLSKVVDIGCGTGTLTRMIAKKSERMVAIDISERNIELAQLKSDIFPNISYVNIDIESFASKVKESSFSTAIAAMTLMTVLDMDKALKTIAQVLKPKSHFIFTITHPCYWPLYWNYANESWFNYRKEIPIEADFKISLDRHDGCVTTHIHRPLEMYIDRLTNAGFSVVKMIEPMPTPEIQKHYPTKWEYPRFLGVKCILNR